MLLMAACGGSNFSPEPPEFTPTPTPVVKDYYVSPTSAECRTEVKGEEWQGLENILGCGYDITGEYMSATSMRGKVVDLGKLDANRLVVMSAPASSSGIMIGGSDSKAFLADLMANAGIEYTPSDPNLCFTGTLSSGSGRSTTLMHVSWVRKLSGSIASFPYVIEAALSDEFAKDASYMRAKNLVDLYGTHFFVHANVGLSVKTVYSTFVDADDREKVKLAEKGYDYAETSLIGKLQPDLTLALSGVKNYGAALTKVFNGGDPALVEYDANTGILGSTTAWETSGDRGNYALTDIYAGDLLPLSEAISDPELKNEVESEIKRRISNSQYSDDTTVMLLQNSNGIYYRYVTGYEESMRLEKEEGLISFGVLGALGTRQTEGAIPLYTGIDSNGSQILSLIQQEENWRVMGYVMKNRTYDTISLYEISDGTRYAYTIEAANSYGSRNEWHPTGAVFYLLRP